MLVLPARPLFAASLATGYAGLAFLLVSLAIGPLNVLRQRRNPVSSDLRRDVGIWAGLLALVHTVIGLQRHMNGQMLRYFFHSADQTGRANIRVDAFGIANHTGLVSALLLVILLAISNDASLRRLGAPRWKRWQQANYLVFFFVVMHTALYQLVSRRLAAAVLIFAVGGVFVLIVQSLAWQRAKGAGGKRR